MLTCEKGVDIAPGKWPQQDILAYYSKEENWPGGPGMYAISKLLVQYCTNEIAKLDIGADRRYASLEILDSLWKWLPLTSSTVPK